jgi:hypothetical protein
MPLNGDDAIDRRTVLKLGGQAGVVGLGVAGYAGSASATEGKGLSWVAFCGCDRADVCFRYAVCKDGDEIYRLAYDAPDDCTVYYKAGREIYRQAYSTRDDYEVLNTGGYHDGEGGLDFDPAMDVHPSASRDPCGILGGGRGFKVEAGEIPCGNNPDCPVVED